MIKYEGDFEGTVTTTRSLSDPDREIPEGTLDDTYKVLCSQGNSLSWEIGMIGGSDTPIYMYANSAPSGWELHTTVLQDNVLSIKGSSEYPQGGVVNSGRMVVHSHTVPYHNHPFLVNYFGLMCFWNQDGAGTVFGYASMGTDRGDSSRKNLKPQEPIWYNTHVMDPATINTAIAFDIVYRPRSAVGIIVHPV
jgi:hypothetical protein